MSDQDDQEEWWPVDPLVLEDSLRDIFGREKLRRKWVEETVSVARELQATPPPRHAAALFCIRLAGLLDDVSTRTSNAITTLEEKPSNDELEAALRDLAAALADVRAALSRDELLWLEYQRDAEAHPWLTYYSHEQERGVVKRRERRAKLVGGKATFVEYRNAIDALTKGRSVDEVAVSIATRILPSLERVSAAEVRCRT